MEILPLDIPALHPERFLMNSSTVTMELSISFVSWINDQLREEVSCRQNEVKVARHDLAFRNFVVGGVTGICVLLMNLIMQS
jgi:hypothetical protein